MRVLIGGGSGFIGVNLSRLLARRGHVVEWVTRHPSRTGSEFNSRVISWNDIHANGLREPYDAVVNLAGQNLMDVRQRWNEEFKSSLMSSRIDTTEALVRAIKEAKQKPKVFIGSSGVGYYKADPNIKYTEDSPGGNSDFLAELSQLWEDASKPLEDTEVRRVTIRIGLVLGRDGGVIQQMYLPFLLCLGGPLGSGQQWFPWVHIDDITSIMMHAIENKSVSGILNAVAPQDITNGEFTSAFAKAMNRPAFCAMPAFMLRLVYGEERAKVMLEGQKVDPQRTIESGYQFIYPDIDSACQQLVKK